MGGRGSSSKKAEGIRREIVSIQTDIDNNNGLGKGDFGTWDNYNRLTNNREKINKLRAELNKPQYNQTAKDRFINNSGMFHLSSQQIKGQNGGVKISTSGLKKRQISEIANYAGQNNLVFENHGAHVVIRRPYANEPKF